MSLKFDFRSLMLIYLVSLFLLRVYAEEKSQPRQYAGLFYPFGSPLSTNNNNNNPAASQKWFFSSNQQPIDYTWFWTNQDRPSSNFYKNSLPSNQHDQLSQWACGRTPISHRFSRIMGGQDAMPHSYPWMVSLAKRSMNNLHLCGGVLITRRHVLTAAHCMEDFKGIEDMSIFAGLHHIHEKTTPYQPLSIDLHPQYNSDTFANDIAVITLTRSVPDDDPRIGTICLPPDDMMGKTYPQPKSSSGVAIGWGSTSFGGRPSTTLKQVVLPILETSQWPCNIYVTYAQGQLCAGELAGGLDTCQADSGGPLMVENSDSRWEVVGITSFGKSWSVISSFFISPVSSRL